MGTVAAIVALAALVRSGGRDQPEHYVEVDPTSGISVSVEATSSALTVEVRQFSVKIGYFRVSTFGAASWQVATMPEDCRQAWEDLGRPTLWIVRGAKWYVPKLRGEGLGRAVYEKLLSYVTARGGWLAPGRCSGTGTSADAERVWQSLRRTHRSSGPFLRSSSID